MPFEIKVPAMAESVHEATVGNWLKQEGDPVVPGEAVVELETDKVNLEITSAQPGSLQKILARTGQTVRTGDVLAIVGDRVQATGPAPAQVPAAASRPKPTLAQDQQTVAPAAQVQLAEVTPVARNLADTLGVDISKVSGTGPGGKITKEDVEAAAKAKPAPPAQTSSGTAPLPQAQRVGSNGRTEERVRLSRRRLTIAQRMAEINREAVMTTTFNEVDMSAVMELRRKHRQEFKDRNGVDLGFMSFFIKATVSALHAYPVLNAELQGDELVYKRYYDIGIAVAADEGLLVPVVRDAEKKSYAEIEKDVLSLATRARDKKLTLEELRGGTFTITNGGVFGSLMSTPILNPPQVGILGMHRIIERPVALNGQVVVRPMMYLAVTYDHRVVEGADSVRFLVRIKELLEDPGRMLLSA